MGASQSQEGSASTVPLPGLSKQRGFRTGYAQAGLELRNLRHEPPINDATIPHRVEVNLREFGQLFNTMDHSPFHEGTSTMTPKNSS